MRYGSILIVRLVSIFLTFASLGWGQVAGTAALSGAITDSSGAAVGGAEINASNLDTGIQRSVKSDSAGKYVLSQLPPGAFRIEVKMRGFKNVRRPRVELPIGVTTILDIQLEVGGATETVEVSAEASTVNSTDASMGTPITGNELRSLPSLDLNPAGLLSLQGGVAFIPTHSDQPGGYGGVSEFDGRSGAVNGARSDQTNITLDGVDCNDPIKGYAFTCAVRVTQSSLAEFRTTTTNYGADSGGRSSAAQVQLITNGGTNSIHGSAYYTNRNEAFDANDYFLNKAGQPRGKFRRHIYGASLGGPVIKNRLFLFGTFERLQESLVESALRTIPTPHVRDGVFFYNCEGSPGCPTSDTSVQGISGTSYTVPAGSYGLSPDQVKAIDPLGIGANPALLSYWATYPTEINDLSAGDGVNFAGYRFASPINNTFMTYIARADFNVDTAGKHTLFWRGSLQGDSNVTAPEFLGGDPVRKTLTNSRGMAIGYTALLTPKLINNFRYGLTRIGIDNAGIRNSTFVNVRFVDELNGFDNLSRDTANRRTPTNDFRDDVTWTHAKHTFGFGGEVRFIRNEKLGNLLSFPGYTINPSWLPDGGDSVTPGAGNCNRPGCNAVPANNDSNNFKDWFTLLLGPVTQVTANYNFNSKGETLPIGANVARRFAANEYEAYFQDQWRATPTLTLTFGLRYMNATPPWETNGNQVIPVPEDSSLHDVNAWFNCREQNMKAGLPSSACGHLQTILGGQANHGRPYYNRDNNNWSPRIAAAWSPRFKDGALGHIFGEGKTVIRGGYSLVYDRMGMGLVNTFDDEGAFGLASTINSPNGGCNIGPGPGARPACLRYTGIFDTSQFDNFPVALGSGTTPQLAPSPGASFPSTPPDGFTVTSSLDSTIRNAHAHMIDFSIERELPGGITFEASYVGRRGRNLPILRDYAMPADLCDPQSHTCALDAARQLVAASANGVALADIGTIPFWEDMFPDFGPSGSNGGCLGFEALGSGCGYSSTQVAYDYIIGYHGVGGQPGFGASTAWQDFDFFAFPAASKLGTFTFFPSQYVNLPTWTTIGRSEYHSLQLSARKRVSHGISFALNYTLSKSLDHSSTPERQETDGFFTGGYTGFTINAWQPNLEYSYSDFDMRHQFNTYLTWDLPVGRGRHFGSNMHSVVNAIVGGWQLSSIMRFNSGVPANIVNGRTWPTNWNLQGNATCAPMGSNLLGLDRGPCPATQNSHSAHHGGATEGTPNLFANPDEAIQHFRFTEPGGRGQRNVLRGDGYGTVDLGIAKSFVMPYSEKHTLLFRWDILNLMNHASFDVSNNGNFDIQQPANFGDYTQMLGFPRRMQGSLRYEF